MIRLVAGLAILALALAPMAGQEAASPGTLPNPELAASPYNAGDQAISLSAGTLLPLVILGGAAPTGKLDIGGGIGFTYRYFLDRQFALGGSIAGGFNGTIAGRSLFIAPLDVDLSWWKAFTPFEAFAEAGLGGYLMRLDTKGMISPFAKLGGGVLWQTGSGWSVGLRLEGWAVPEIHLDPYAGLTRTGLFLDASLIGVYHI